MIVFTKKIFGIIFMLKVFPKLVSTLLLKKRKKETCLRSLVIIVMKKDTIENNIPSLIEIL